MNLKDLVGKHQFSGLDNISKKVDGWGYDTINGYAFIIDGITYEIFEDPDDGYRSYCTDIEHSHVIVKNNFAPHYVICEMKNDTILVVTDILTKKIILEIGTDYYDDWYPCAIMCWNPESLAINNGYSIV